jgi:hypothetical protein
VVAAEGLAMLLVPITEELQVVRVVVPEETEMLILALQELLVKEVLVDPFLTPVVPVAVAVQEQQEQMEALMPHKELLEEMDLLLHYQELQ